MEINVSSNIKDVTTDNFMSDVIESSKEKPIIVDFWAPWCEPCKQLGPLLEDAVKEQKDKITLAKIDIDQNQSRMIDVNDNQSRCICDDRCCFDMDHFGLRSMRIDMHQ